MGRFSWISLEGLWSLLSHVNTILDPALQTFPAQRDPVVRSPQQLGRHGEAARGASGVGVQAGGMGAGRSGFASATAVGQAWRFLFFRLNRAKTI